MAVAVVTIESVDVVDTVSGKDVTVEIALGPFTSLQAAKIRKIIRIPKNFIILSMFFCFVLIIQYKCRI